MTVMQSREGDIMSVETAPVALVTGASAGIGEAAAHALVGAGFTVYGTSRSAAAGEKRDGVVLLPLDVTDDGSVAGVVREVLARSGRIDVLVNNAGVGIAGAAEESSIEQARAVRDQRVRLDPHDSRGAAAHARAGRRPDHQCQLRPGSGAGPRSWPCTRRPSTPSRATPSRWTTKCASTGSGCCWWSPATPTPRST